MDEFVLEKEKRVAIAFRGVIGVVDSLLGASIIAILLLSLTRN